MSPHRVHGGLVTPAQVHHQGGASPRVYIGRPQVSERQSKLQSNLGHGHSSVCAGIGA